MIPSLLPINSKRVYKPNSVLRCSDRSDGYLSCSAIAGGIMQPTILGLAPGRCFPRLQSLAVTRELLPHDFNLTGSGKPELRRCVFCCTIRGLGRREKRTAVLSFLARLAPVAVSDCLFPALLRDGVRTFLSRFYPGAATRLTRNLLEMSLIVQVTE